MPKGPALRMVRHRNSGDWVQMSTTKGRSFELSLRELGGAFGDLGTLLPLMLGSIAVAGLSPVPVLAGFGFFYVMTAIVYRLPIPVQPMKAVAAVLMTAGLSPGGLAATGVMLGAIMLVLGSTGWINRIARIVPRSVLAGLQLGLGLSLLVVSLPLMGTSISVAAFVLAILLILPRVMTFPAVLCALGAGVMLGPLVGAPGIPVASGAPDVASLVGWPELGEFEDALFRSVLPQLALTLTNAILLTSIVAGDYFGDRAAHVTPGRLSTVTGIANLLTAPFGALPMCHGAGGLVAHHRFGARSGTAPLVLGVVLAALAIYPEGLDVLGAIPLAALGAMLAVASAELAFSKRLFDCRPSCAPVIAVAAAVTLWADPFWGLAAGGAGEYIRGAVLRAFGKRSQERS